MQLHDVKTDNLMMLRVAVACDACGNDGVVVCLSSSKQAHLCPVHLCQFLTSWMLWPERAIEGLALVRVPCGAAAGDSVSQAELVPVSPVSLCEGVSNER